MRLPNILPMASVLVFVSVFTYLIFFRYSKDNQIKSVRVGGKEVMVEIASTQAQLAKGLMFRKELGENSGMLFIFPKSGTHSFWMANTYIPLDIIWLNENKEIVYISANTPPCTETGNLLAVCKSYFPNKKAKYVLEVNGGWAEKNKVRVGDNVEFEIKI
ncbi:DUF192 domain-containing protein [candidate division WWE3 bacterium]|nr:DUF192 domain-containing protein [candidate division WWE3 bacterium]